MPRHPRRRINKLNLSNTTLALVTEPFAPISARVRRMSVSPTIAMSTRAAELRARGIDVISLAVGEPDFDTPAHIIEAAHRAAKAGKTRYTAADGGPEVKAAAIEKFRRENGLTFTPEQIHVASGAKQVIYNAFAATLEPGDEVVIFTPTWVSYIDVVEFCGGRAVIVPTSAQDGFQPSTQALAAAISPRTRWVLLNSPNNPTGAVWPEPTIAALLDVVRAHPGVLVMSDEIYEQLVFDGHRPTCLAALAPDLAARMLVVNGVSKTYAMTGWRIGYAAGPEWLTSAMAKVQSQTASSPCTPAQFAAAEAITSDQSLVGQWRSIMATRRDIALRILQDCTRLSIVVPHGAFYIFPGVGACLGLRTPQGQTLENDTQICEYLLDAAKVATVPGAAFHASPFVRLSFALDESRITEACRRIVQALDALTD